ncbi:chitobiase/beta-hexosaminidase C-terminal domain-containing protein [Gelatiniphilus marinus]|uniref:Chitobiase/beta-hexosaminidase C-terminal domain-containing protein n=1 Tax=Gelatiniphilus marinus TaxID=1759464 RepID=A0ABW5JNS4_9FLAO
MRLLIQLCLVFCVALSCKQQTETGFLKQNTISLAQPRVIANKTLIDSFVTIYAMLKVDDVVIRYTSNGEEPSLNSEKYKQPIQASKPGIYKFKAFHNHWKPSKVTEVELLKKGISADAVLWHSKASEKYKGQGANTVINQTKASLKFTDNQWVGFDTTAISTIKFNKKTHIKSVTISYLNDLTSWIFPPERITIFINNDSKKEHILKPLNQLVDRKNETVKIPIETEVLSLKIQINNLQSIPKWHEGKGQKAWLFIDEFIFN